MERIKGLSTGSKIVLGCGMLLFFSLFFTWQNLQVDFGRAGIATLELDGWDFWGLLIGLVTLAVVGLVVVVHDRGRGIGRHPLGRRTARARGLDFRGHAPEEPDRRRLDVDELPRAGARCGCGRRLVPRLGERACVGASGQPLEQEHAVLAGPVVVLHHAIDPKSERLVEGDRVRVRR